MTALRRWLPVLLAALWSTCMAYVILTRLSFSNDISKFLADSRDARLTRISRQLAQSDLTKTITLVVGAESGDRARALAAADALADALAAHGEVAWVRRGWDPAGDPAIHELYFPHRVQFASEDPAALDEQLSDAGLERAASERIDRLRPPTSDRIEAIAARDPLLLHSTQLDRLEAARAGPVDAEGRFATEDGRAVLILASVHSPFDSSSQAPLQAAISERFAELDREAQASGDDLTLIQSGVARFALRTESQIRFDITRISMISMIGVIALFLVLFRSVWMLVLSMLPLLVGVLTAVGMSLVIFGELHGLTLVFGVSLVGVCIDYPIHLFTHHALYRSSDRDEMLAGVRPGLLLGALTTIAGFLGMGWAAFPGIREVAVFAALGILGALVTTLWVLPALLPSRTRPLRSQQWLMRGAQRLVASMSRSRRLLVALPFAAIAIMAIGLPRLEYEDDVSVLAERAPDLSAEDDEVRSLVTRMDGGRLIVALGDDDEEALIRNDEVHRRLGEAVAAGELAEFRSLHTFLWSKRLQAANRERFCEREDLPGAIDRAYVDLGLPPASFEPFAEDLARLCAGEPSELDWPTMAGSPLSPVLSSMRIDLGRQVGIFTLVRDVEDLGLLRARMAGIDDVLVFDQRSLMIELYGRHRSQTTELVALGLLAVTVILFARHGDLRLTLAAVVPAILAAGMTLALLVLFGQAITLLHVVGLVLVLSMGVDYGVFLTESRGDSHEVAATLISLLACCMSTVLSIGLLGMSSNPALQAIGLTTGLGVLFSLILAPTALVLAGAVGFAKQVRR
ncbi:MMPL family transporter [Nannocystaceae bacterium ST9]